MQKHKKVKSFITKFLKREMPSTKDRGKSIPEPTKLKGRGPLTIKEIETAVNTRRD